MFTAKRMVVKVVLAAFLLTIVGVSLQGAWAQETPPFQLAISVGQPTLLAKGVAVSVPITVTCSGLASPQTVYRTTAVRQKVQRGISQGFASTYDYATSFTCDGTPQTEVVTIYAQSNYPNAGAFKKGVAVVTAFVQVCGYTGSVGDYGGYECNTASVDQEVRIS